MLAPAHSGRVAHRRGAGMTSVFEIPPPVRTVSIKASGRIGSLDSLRGIAALIVVFYHLSLVVPGIYPWLQTIPPLRVVFAGTEAVYVFFVLSGFVLYLSLQRHDRDRWLTFAARRLARLYPPVAAAVLFSAALYLLVAPGPMPAFQGWFTDLSWTEPPSRRLLVGHLLLLDPNRFHTLDNPMWSLVVEVRLSLLFPLVAAAIRRRSMATLIGCVAISLVARHIMSSGHPVGRVDPFFTLQFLDLFAIGAWMAHYRDTLARLVRIVPAPLTVLAALFALIESGRAVPYMIYAAAVLVVAASFSYPLLSRLYGLRPLVWLGERSFSLYLVHVPMLLTAVHLLAGRMPIAAILAGVVPVSLIAAELFWLTIERPSIRLSRTVGRRLSGRRASSTPA